MKIKWVIFGVLAASFVLVTYSSLAGVSTRDIDTVRNKAVLDDQDLKIIDDFLADRVRRLVNTRDFTSIAKLRTVIMSRQSTQGQYAQQFSESAHKHIAAGFEQAQTLRPEERKTNVVINLLILVDSLADVRLTDLALARLKNENMVIRYWAVHCLTNPGIVQKLNSQTTSNSNPAVTIAEQLKELVETSRPEIVALMARFAASVNIPQGEELLTQIADMRIKKYADWTVEYELMDIDVLKLLESKIPLSSLGLGGPMGTASANKPAIARRFAQLYSYVIQRYIKGGHLIDTQKQHLTSVLVETEAKCISRLLGEQQATIRRAVEHKSDAAALLLDEHNRLLGDGTTPGQLPLKLGFDYGTTSSGAKRTAPIPLPDPPATN